MKHREKKTAAEKTVDPNNQIFQMFDKDGSGLLSTSEWIAVRQILQNLIIMTYMTMLQVMNLMGLKTTPEEAAQLFATVDKNGDGKIDLKEFISYIGN